MYIPKMYEVTDKAEILAFMRRFSFATLITAKDGLPEATHLPFLVREQGGEIILSSHFAKANRHWQQIETENVLVIFSEPHAYISPSHYSQELNVPTWNYLAVHVYGQGHIITGANETLALLENTIDNYEQAYRQQWEGLPTDFKLKMIKGIVAFDIRVTGLQAKKKLSQNKTQDERQRIIASLSNSPYGTERQVAEYMFDNE